MSTGIGIFFGLVLLVGAMVLGGGLGAFLDLESVMITLGGTLAATLVSFPLDRAFKMLRLFLRLFREERSSDFEGTVARLVELGHKASEKSVFSLEQESKTEENRYIKLGLTMLVRGASAQQIGRRYAVELESVRMRHQEGVQMFGFMSRAAPSFGLLGTLIGLINTLRAVGGSINPETLGPSMGLALLTTLYGCFLAFFLFLPASEKLKAYSAHEQSLIRIVREAILMVKEGQPSRELEEILNSYLPVDQRKSVVDKLILVQGGTGAKR